MRLLVTRHGETQWNLSGKMNGTTDVDLTLSGEEQARTLGRKLQEEGVEVIIASPLRRAAKTAEIIGGILGSSPIYDERLREINLGSLEGAQRGTAAVMEAKARLATRFPGGGESAMQVFHRISDFLEDISHPYRDKTVLLVTHGGIARIVNCYFADMDNREFAAFSIQNCQVLEYRL